MVKDRHVIEALGKTKVVIENGEITSIDKPQIKYCPMFYKYHDIKDLDEESIRKNIEYRIDKFGMCTKNRVIKMKDLVTVGVSEILRTNIEEGNIDAVVGVCEGVGTVVMEDADIVQGVGGRVSGLISTTPIPEVIEKFKKENVIMVDPENASLDPVKGLEMAVDAGYKNIAITILPSEVIKELREYPVGDDVNVYIFVAHTTGSTPEEVELMFKYADIVTACASKYVDEYVNIHKPYYYGDKISIYCASSKGREFLDLRLEKIGKSLTTNDYSLKNDMPNPLK